MCVQEGKEGGWSFQFPVAAPIEAERDRKGRMKEKWLHSISPLPPSLDARAALKCNLFRKRMREIHSLTEV